ncbi:MAG: GIY-YIG nuclease family protein [Candidatus Pacebacteria bacterium]|nr:GIY-YIG nuclease family protein [Candidatus Paceibacterota bacterium]NUQ57666.1 GIY-YIG nuclease family protein [Candidatus Paceibacter sp.]
MFFYVYALRSLRDGKMYIGYTNNLRRRLEEHNSGENISTKPRRPLKLIYYEACVCESDARRREKYFKVTGGRRFLAKRLKDYLRINSNLY